LGLVGAVTNSIGNEAMIDVEYDSEEAMRVVAREYTRRHYRELMYVDTIALFATALTKETWDRLGELDPRFEIGYFEDDDYCRRAKNEGLKIGIAEDTFIHHEHSASFDVLGEARKREQFDANLKIYEEKWGPWSPHRFRRRAK
jgi:GT2 family glycosyltransferase